MDPSGNIEVNTVEISGSTFSKGTGIYVDVNTGADTPNCGTQASPCKTITRALAMTPGNETIYVAKGLYDATSGENFPLQLKTGNVLIGETWLKVVGQLNTPVTPVVIAPLAFIRSSNPSSVILAAPKAFIAGLIIEFGLTDSTFSVIDGNGQPITIKYCALQGPGGSSGLSVGARIWSGSKISGSHISGFPYGIFTVGGGGRSTITANTIAKNGLGVFLGPGTYTVSENIFKNNTFGISSDGSDGRVYRNRLTGNYEGMQFADIPLGKSMKIIYNTISGNGIFQSVGLRVWTTYDHDTEPAIVAGNGILGNDLGVVVGNQAKAMVNSNDISCNKIWNMYAAGQNADTRIDARGNSWKHQPPVLNPGRVDGSGCYPAEDVDICYEYYYAGSQPPPYEPASKGSCG
jgi:hypothetical protein